MCPFLESGTQGGGVNITGAIGSVGGDIVGRDKIIHVYGPAQLVPGPIFYNLPSLPEHYRPRVADAAVVLGKLQSATGAVGITSPARAVGLQGMGGIGKTVLATALVHDAHLRDAFPDGVIWLTFGRQTSALSKATELALALTGTRPSFESLAEARGQLGLYTAGKRLLVVLDDVWEPGVADPFTGLGPACRVLVTTRDARVLERIQAERHEIGLLEPEAARVFLAEASGLTAGALPPDADQIIHECGRLPLALAAVGALIRHATYTWSDALNALREAALGELETPASWLSDAEQRSVAAVLEVSVRALSGDVRTCFLACAAFREDVDIPEATLLRLWTEFAGSERQGKRVAQALVDRSLIRRDEQHRYRIHDLYLDYLRVAGAPLEARHRTLLETYHRYCKGSWADGPDDGYFFQHLGWHLVQAGAAEELTCLLFNLAWLKRKSESAGIEGLISDTQLVQHNHEVAQLGAVLRRSAHVAIDCTQLEPLLYGRLLPTDGPRISELLDCIRREWSGTLVPMRGGYLTRPDRPLRSSVEGYAAAWVRFLRDTHCVLARHGALVRLWNLEDDSPPARVPELGHGHSMEVLADRQLVISLQGNSWTIWNFEGEKPHLVENVKYTTGMLLSGRLLPLSDSLAISYQLLLSPGVVPVYHSKIVLVDLHTGAELQEFGGLPGEVYELAALSGCDFLLGSSDDGVLIAWNIRGGSKVWRIEEPDDPVCAIVVLPGCRRALVGSDSGLMRLLDIANGTEMLRLSGHTNKITGFAVLDDGRFAVSCSLDRTLRVWDLEFGKAISLLILDDAILSLSVACDNRTVAIGDASGKVSGFRLR
jgi:hypothetical protein